jgi:hypothetical protein
MNTQIRSFMTNRKVVALSAAAIGFVTGGVVGTLVTRRLFQNAMLEMLDDMKHDMKMEKLQRRFDSNFQVFDKVFDKASTSTPTEPTISTEKFNEERSLRIIQGEGKDVELEAQAWAEQAEAMSRIEAARHHTFDTPTDDWDYEAEKNIRSDKEIYVIHRDEYVNDEMGYHQSTIEYYTEDGVMTDALQHPIYNYTDFVGHEALDQFGHGSGDNDVVYVRNEREKAEFEVLRNSGSYEREVLGMEAEEEYRDQDLRHSRYPQYKFPIRE